MLRAEVGWGSVAERFHLFFRWGSFDYERTPPIRDRISTCRDCGVRRLAGRSSRSDCSQRSRSDRNRGRLKRAGRLRQLIRESGGEFVIRELTRSDPRQRDCPHSCPVNRRRFSAPRLENGVVVSFVRGGAFQGASFIVYNEDGEPERFGRLIARERIS